MEWKGFRVASSVDRVVYSLVVVYFWLIWIKLRLNSNSYFSMIFTVHCLSWTVVLECWNVANFWNSENDFWDFQDFQNLEEWFEIEKILRKNIVANIISQKFINWQNKIVKSFLRILRICQIFRITEFTKNSKILKFGQFGQNSLQNSGKILKFWKSEKHCEIIYL